VLIHSSPGGTDVIEMLILATYIAFESEIIYRGVTTETVFYCHVALRRMGQIERALEAVSLESRIIGNEGEKYCT
jgi:hypothetical protein